jgi:predicted histidine transporter YuiF (NhaC family)
MVYLWLPETFWLSLTNALLGAAVVLFILVIVVGLLCGSASALRKRRHYRAEMDHDLEEIFGDPHPQAAPTPATSQPGILAHVCACVGQIIAALKRWHAFHRHG